jgi:hypothetical protein
LTLGVSDRIVAEAFLASGLVKSPHHLSRGSGEPPGIAPLRI